MKNLLAWYQASRPGRMLTLYADRAGNVLAGGSAYAALFSVFGALVAGFSIAGLVLGSNEQLLDAVVRATADVFPGLLTVDGSQGVFDPKALLSRSNLFSTTGIIAFAVALFSGLGWVFYMRQAIRMVYGLPPDKRNYALKKAVDVVWLACLGALLLASAVLSMALTSVGGLVMDVLGVDGLWARALTRLGGFCVVVLVFSVAMFIIFRWMAGLHLPFNRLRSPCLVCGLVFAVLTQFSGLFVGSSANPIVATGALLATLLVLFNLMCRVVLYGTAWLATKDRPETLEQGPAEAVNLIKDEG